MLVKRDRNELRTSRRWIGVGVAVFLGSFIVGVLPSAALADAYSAYGYYTAGGHQYQNQAYVITDTDYAVAGSEDGWYTGSTPAGYAGAQGRLYKSNGSLSCAGTTQYNSTAGYYAVGYSCARTTSGTWYSYGLTYDWTGSGYTPVLTFKSPNQNS